MYRISVSRQGSSLFSYSITNYTIIIIIRDKQSCSHSKQIVSTAATSIQLERTSIKLRQTDNQNERISLGEAEREREKERMTEYEREIS